MAGPNMVSFTKEAPGINYAGYPPEMQQQVSALMRRQALADALTAQGMQDPQTATQMVSGIAIKNSPLSGLANMLTPVVAERAQKKIDEEKAGLARDYNTQLAEAVRNYTQRMTGSPGTPEVSGVPAAQPEVGSEDTWGMGNQGVPAQAAVPAQPATDQQKRAAIISAMTSGYGPMREIATQDWKELLKNQLSTKDIGGFMKDFTPESVQAFVASGGKTPLVRNPNFRAAGDVTFDTTTGKPGAPVNTFSDVGTLGTDAQGNAITGAKNTSTNRPVFAPRGVNVNTTVNNHAANEETNAVVKAHQDSRKLAEDAATDVKTLQQATQALNAGIKSGTGMGWRNELDKLAVTLGFKGDNGSVANTDTFMRTMAGRMLSHAKELRPMSDSDVNILQEIEAGRNLTEAGMKKLIEIGMDNALGKIEQHNKRIGQYTESRFGYKDQMYVPMPTFPQLPPGTSDNPNATGLSIGPKRPTSQANSRPQAGAVNPDEEARRLGGRRIQ